MFRRRFASLDAEPRVDFDFSGARMNSEISNRSLEVRQTERKKKKREKEIEAEIDGGNAAENMYDQFSSLAENTPRDRVQEESCLA